MAASSQTNRMLRCKHHPPMTAKVFCETCRADLCSLCVGIKTGEPLCQECGSLCRPLTPEDIEERHRNTTRALIKIPPPPTPSQILAKKNASTSSAARSAVRTDSVPAVIEPPMPPLPPAPPEIALDPKVCENHPSEKAWKRCEACMMSMCAQCVKHGVGGPVCPHCSCFVRDLTLAEQGIKPRPYMVELVDALRYPTIGDGKLMLVLGGLFYWIGNSVIARGPYTLAFKMTVSGFFFAYMMKIIRTTANNNDKIPDWPSASNIFDEMLIPFFQTMCAFVMCVLPASLLLIGFPPQFIEPPMPPPPEYLTSTEGAPTEPLGYQNFERQRQADLREWREEQREKLAEQTYLYINPIIFVLLFVGIYLLPMGILAVTMFRTVSALHPGFLIESAIKTGRYYFLAYGTLVFAFFCEVFVAPIAMMVPFFGGFLLSILWVYSLMVEGRILGVLYRYNVERLNWFPKPESSVPTPATP